MHKMYVEPMMKYCDIIIDNTGTSNPTSTGSNTLTKAIAAQCACGDIIFLLVNSVGIFLEDDNSSQVSRSAPCTGNEAARCNRDILSQVSICGGTCQGNRRSVSS